VIVGLASQTSQAGGTSQCQGTGNLQGNSLDVLQAVRKADTCFSQTAMKHAAGNASPGMPADVLMPAPHSKTILRARPCLICSAMPFRSSDGSTCWTASSYSCQRDASSALEGARSEIEARAHPPNAHASSAGQHRTLCVATCSCRRCSWENSRSSSLSSSSPSCNMPHICTSARALACAVHAGCIPAACVDRPPAHCLPLFPQRLSVHQRFHGQYCWLHQCQSRQSHRQQQRRLFRLLDAARVYAEAPLQMSIPLPEGWMTTTWLL
jgi:hypothetical protein